jgi:hypothetical protein
MPSLSKQKTAVLTIRIQPRIKAAAEKAAQKDHRSLTNLIEVLLVQRCREAGIRIAAQTEISVKK